MVSLTLHFFMTYKDLQTKLKQYRDQGLTEIRLNSCREVLEVELERLTKIAPGENSEVMEVAIVPGENSEVMEVAIVPGENSEVIEVEKVIVNLIFTCSVHGDFDEEDLFFYDCVRYCPFCGQEVFFKGDDHSNILKMIDEDVKEPRPPPK
jgi:hypothetical protein